jgi:long-chain acyl-CoA synthetase
MSLGLGRGDAVALLLDPSPEFHVIDTSVLLARAVPFSLTLEDPAERHGLLLRLSGATIVVAGPGREQIAHAAVTAAGVPGMRVVVADADATGSAPRIQAECLTVDEVAAAGQGIAGNDVGSAGLEDSATLIFTSGTTGTPKGVRLSHRALVSSLAATDAIAPIGLGGNVLSFLPTAHIAERFMSHYQGMAFRLTIHSASPTPQRCTTTSCGSGPTGSSRFPGSTRSWPPRRSDSSRTPGWGRNSRPAWPG